MERCANSRKRVLPDFALYHAVYHTRTDLVGDVVNATDGFRVFAGTAAHLQVVLAGNLVELVQVLAEVGQLDVDAGADGGTQVGRTEGQETQSVIVRERQLLLNLVDTLWRISKN